MKTAVVTGAGGSMGSSLVQALEREGINCVLIEKKADLFERLIHLLDGSKHDFFTADFTDQREVMDVINKITKKHKKIDYLFNVAGIGIYKKLENLSLSEWRASMDINLNSVFMFSKGLLPLLKKSKEAMVFSFGSGMGVYPKANRVAYCTSKFALRGLSLTLSKEFEGRGVDFVLLTLGSVMTDFGTGGLIYRKKLNNDGKKYLSVDGVIKKVLEITNSASRKPEYSLYPEGYEKESKNQALTV